MEPRSLVARQRTFVAFCSRMMQTSGLPCGTVMPDKPEEQAHNGNSNHVCYHVNRSFVWFAAAEVQAILNCIVLRLVIFWCPR